MLHVLRWASYIHAALNQSRARIDYKVQKIVLNFPRSLAAKLAQIPIFITCALLFMHAAAAENERIFDNWALICDANRNCSITTRATWQGSGARNTLSLTLARSVKTNWLLSLSSDHMEPAPDTALIVQVDDGDAYRFDAGAELAVLPSKTLAPAGTSAFYQLLDTMRHGQTAYATFITAQGSEAGAALPLAGLDAALHFADELIAEHK